MPYQQQLTDLGRDALAQMQTSTPFTFTKIQLGRGETPIANVPEMTALVDPVMTSGIAEVSWISVGQVTVTTKIALASIPQIFDLNEIGLFAQIGGAATPEILYAVCVSDPQTADIISPSMPGGSTNEHTISIAVIVGNTQNVTAVFDPDIRVSNIGLPETGAGWYSRRVGNEFMFKRAVAQSGIQITEDNDTVRFTVLTQFPVGGMIPFAGTTPPAGWFLCHGQLLARSQYPQLSAILGSTYGGDANTFNLPDCRDRTLVGASGSKGLGLRAGTELETLSVAQMPHHAHGVADYGHVHGLAQSDHAHGHGDGQHVHPVNSMPVDHREGTGYSWRAIEWTDYPYLTTYFAASNISIYGAQAPIALYASLSNIAIYGEGGGQPHNNMQPYLAINYIIRAA
jgi:microcystin-dependent protein